MARMMCHLSPLTLNIIGTDMKAVFYEQHGTAEVLQVGERPYSGASRS